MKPGSKKSKDEIKDKKEQQIQINNKYVKFDDAAKQLNISEKDLTIMLYKCPRIRGPTAYTKRILKNLNLNTVFSNVHHLIF